MVRDDQAPGHAEPVEARLVAASPSLDCSRDERGALLAVAFALLLAIPGTLSVIDRRHDRDPSQRVRAAAIREAPKSGVACAFEPADLLMADVLPNFVDPYGQMLLDAVRYGSRFPSAAEAFKSELSQRTLRTQLDACSVVVVGWRGEWQMNANTRAELDARFSPFRESVLLRK